MEKDDLIDFLNKIKEKRKEKLEIYLKERERNLRLLKLVKKLKADNDFESIELLRTMVEKDTDSMKRSFEIVTKQK